MKTEFKFGIIIMITILVAQVVAHIGDFVFNDGAMVGVILMISVACHLLNNYKEIE